MKSFVAGGKVVFSGTWDLAGQFLARSYFGDKGQRFIWQVATSGRAADGKLTALEDAAADKDLALTYDALDRLASVVGTGLRGYQDCEYDYDLSGNRDTETCYDRAVTYTYETSPSDSSRLAQLSWTASEDECGSSPPTLNRSFSSDNAGNQETGYPA